MERVKVGVLISGRGGNMQALIDAAARPDYPAEIVLVVSNRPEAEGLDRATAAGFETELIDHTRFASRSGFEGALSDTLRASGVELVCLAGFMRVLTADFVELWRDRLINIHPSLLPAFPGLHTHAEAIAAGVRISGCTVHFVREAVDDGPIIGQAAVPVLPDDTPETLGARVLSAEHRLYPHCLELVAGRRVQVVANRVRLPDIAKGRGGRSVLFNPSPDPSHGAGG